MVRAEDRPLHHGLRPLARGQAVAEHFRGNRARAEVARAAHGAGGRAAQHLGGRLGARAEPGDDDATSIGVCVRHLTRLRRELLGVEHTLELPLGSPVQTRQALRQLRFADVETDQQRIGGDILEPFRDDLDFHPAVPPLSASARRIISRSPWVVSSSVTRSISNHWASAASLPASTSSESGYAR